MRVISTAELAVLVDELQELVGFYIERFYEVSEGRFRIKLSKSKVQVNLQIILSHTINKTQYVEKQEQPSGFAVSMRKMIEGFHIESIKQLNNDRIALIELEKGESVINLIIEMFGKGNLIITDNSMKILLSYKSQEYKDRVIRKGMDYKAPTQSESYKIEKPASITPMIYRDETDRVIDYSITELEKYSGNKMQKFQTLQEALDLFYYENPVGEQKEEHPEQKKMMEEIKNSIKKQEKILSGIENEIEENKNAGKVLFDNMHMINEMIKAAQQNKRMTKEELQSRFPKIKVLNVDLKDKKITIELSDE